MGAETSTPYLSCREAAEYLRRSSGAIRNLVMRRAIPFHKPGGRLLFVKSELDDWVRRSDGLTIKEWQNAG
ncbi:helix-turn-helix domain-containing protein [Thermodesulfobacteriota bacterium]